MGFTKRELIEFFDRLTGLVSEENRKEAEFQIQVFMDSFEKSYPYETTAHMGKDMPCHPSVHVASMPEPIQREIKEEVTARLRETGDYSPENVECAMNSKLCDFRGGFGY